MIVLLILTIKPKLLGFLLTKDLCINTKVGKDIAHYLLEFLPFTQGLEQLINTTNLILQKDLISKQEKAKLWK